MPVDFSVGSFRLGSFVYMMVMVVCFGATGDFSVGNVFQSTFFSFSSLFQSLFAFQYKEVFPVDGWKVYDPLAEYKRQVATTTVCHIKESSRGKSAVLLGVVASEISILLGHM